MRVPWGRLFVQAISALALVGTLVGQLVFGFLGDRLGRKRSAFLSFSRRALTP